jgi:hypothetical protein
MEPLASASSTRMGAVPAFACRRRQDISGEWPAGGPLEGNHYTMSSASSPSSSDDRDFGRSFRRSANFRNLRCFQNRPKVEQNQSPGPFLMIRSDSLTKTTSVNRGRSKGRMRRTASSNYFAGSRSNRRARKIKNFDGPRSGQSPLGLEPNGQLHDARRSQFNHHYNFCNSRLVLARQHPCLSNGEGGLSVHIQQ